MIQIEADIPSVNGAAIGTVTFRGEDGASVHRATGNWMSAVTRSRCCQAVADKLCPAPSRRADDTDESFAGRQEKRRKRHRRTAKEIDRLLLGALDGLERQAATDRAAADLAALHAAENGGSPGEGSANGRESLRPPEYIATHEGISRRRPSLDGGHDAFVPLTNFTARIVADVTRDDGVERERAFQIEATIRGRVPTTFALPAKQFIAMNWPVEHLGAEAIVYAGVSARDHARAAMQVLGGSPRQTAVYTHIGWRSIGGRWCYLDAGGGIGAEGRVAGIEVDVPDGMKHFLLPDPPDGEELIQAVRASVRLLDLATPLASVPLFAAIYRAPLGNCDFAVHFAGASGVFKSELCALAERHFGPSMDARNLPANWSSTDNALEGQAFVAKDAILVVDDFAPCGTTIDVQRLHQKADRLIRGAGNGAGRSRDAAG